jgi:hypothetical protein
MQKTILEKTSLDYMNFAVIFSILVFLWLH